ncbi:MAG: sulfotransferase [Proteobacteria bacterium]|nr:sulfotransferase [Pseudomonadota bacterium]
MLGMPRSGTSLVEQILSSHPEVYGAGELLTINNIKDDITTEFQSLGLYPECMSLCEQSGLLKYSEKYLDELNMHTSDASKITDKLPGNIFNIGLIKTLFPYASIIHCNRNPLDTCTSIFLTRLNDTHGYACDLVELGKYYLDYERLVSHWRSLFSAEIFEVQYEELVSNQEEVSKQLIAYIGLEWDEKCMNSHTNKRTVRTASNLQVRKPMYRGSINRWKQYEKQLKPLIEILQHMTK